jgi:ribosomal protein S4
MGTARSQIAHKHFRLDVTKIKRAQRLLKTGTETETVDRALDVVIAEHERNRLTREANERFVRSGVEIRDVYGKLAK